MIRFQALQHFVAVHVGHQHVEQDQVGQMLRGFFQRLFTVFGQNHLTICFQQIAQHLAVECVIIHDEHFLQDIFGHGHASSAA